MSSTQTTVRSPESVLVFTAEPPDGFWAQAGPAAFSRTHPNPPSLARLVLQSTQGTQREEVNVKEGAPCDLVPFSVYNMCICKDVLGTATLKCNWYSRWWSSALATISDMPPIKQMHQDHAESTLTCVGRSFLEQSSTQTQFLHFFLPSSQFVILQQKCFKGRVQHETDKLEYHLPTSNQGFNKGSGVLSRVDNLCVGLRDLLKLQLISGPQKLVPLEDTAASEDGL